MSAIINSGSYVSVGLPNPKNAPAVRPKWTWSWGDWIKSLVLRVLSVFSSSTAKELAELNASYETDLPPDEAQAKAKAERIRSQVLGARREILNKDWIVNHKVMRSIEAIIAGTYMEANAAMERLVTDDSVWPEGDFRSSDELLKVVRPIIYTDYTNGVIDWLETDKDRNGKIGFIPKCRYALTGVETDRAEDVETDKAEDLNELLYDPSPKRPTPRRFPFSKQDMLCSGSRANTVYNWDKYRDTTEHNKTVLLNKDTLKARLLSSSSEEVS